LLVDDVSWQAEPGEHWALLGPNGAGKTTVLTLLAAVRHPSRGSVELLGRRMGRTNVFDLREQIGFVDARLGRRFFPTMTVQDVVSTGAANTIALRDVSRAQASRVTELMELLGVAQLASRAFADCSHGERMRALIARALVPSPRLLLLDEPGGGLDFEGRETLLAALGRVAEDPELTTVTATHHVEELPRSTTHALLLARGRIVAAGAVEETLTDARLSACFGLPIRVTCAGGRWSATAAL
jgi:iron complex transport system ATP-binding protein